MNKKQVRNMLKDRYYIASGKSNSEIKKMKRRDNAVASLFVATPVLVLAIFVFAAFGIAIWLSFRSGRLDPSFKHLKYVGWKNWSLLFNESRDAFVHAIKNTMTFALVTTGCNVLGALIIATVLNSKNVRRKNIFMVFYFLPQVTAGVAVAVIFIRLTNKNTIFGLDIIGKPSDALWVMIISSIWSGISGGIVTFNTAFSGVDPSQNEAAALDGANVWTKFVKITVPSLGPILAYTIITSIIGGMGVFDQAYILNASGASPDSVMTWAFLGFARIIGTSSGGSAYGVNVGLGVVTLTLLGITIFVLTRIANIIRPMERT